MRLPRRLSLLALAGLALATGACAETDRGLEAKDEAKRIDRDAQRYVDQINQGPRQ